MTGGGKVLSIAPWLAARAYVCEDCGTTVRQCAPRDLVDVCACCRFLRKIEERNGAEAAAVVRAYLERDRSERRGESDA